MRKYDIERNSGKEISALDKGLEHKTEQMKLKMMSSHPSTCGIFTTMTTEARLSEACLIHCWCRGCVCVCVLEGKSCTLLFCLLSDKKTKIFF